ncbi:MAG TPA: transglutaminase family protein [Caproiciproducens sp.]|nr:transglutaminase family protein [Caproiciproducens sp.]
MGDDSTNLPLFLAQDSYVDFSSPVIQKEADALFAGIDDKTKIAETAFLFVRDEIPHSFDCNASVITAKASDVLVYKTGICHAKSNLLAALLRARGIPAGFCYQHLTLADDESKGYCLHCYNAVYLNNQWIKLDARGNKAGVDAQFSLGEPKLAFANRPRYDEYFYPGIYARPHGAAMKMLEKAKTIQDVMNHIPDNLE